MENRKVINTPKDIIHLSEYSTLSYLKIKTIA